MVKTCDCAFGLRIVLNTEMKTFNGLHVNILHYSEVIPGIRLGWSPTQVIDEGEGQKRYCVELGV